MYGLNIIAGARVKLSPDLLLAIRGAETGTVEKIVAKSGGAVHKIFSHTAMVKLDNEAVAVKRRIPVCCLKLEEKFV